MFKAAPLRVYKAIMACALGAAMGLAAPAVVARQPASASGLPAVALAELPPQGRATYALIHEGGPFPFEKDGTVFGNRERLLPRHKRGFYREYTVRTPGVRDRGARRIICGGAPRTPDVCYYTSDHYASFRAIRP